MFDITLFRCWDIRWNTPRIYHFLLLGYRLTQSIFHRTFERVFYLSNNRELGATDTTQWVKNHTAFRLSREAVLSFWGQMFLVNSFCPEYVLWNGAGKVYWTLTRPVHVKRRSNVCVSGQKPMVWQFQFLCYCFPLLGTTCFLITLRQDFNGSCLCLALWINWPL